MFPKSLQDTISHLLHTQSRLRDDDRRLTATVWAQVIKKIGINPRKMTGLEFLTLYAEGEMPHAESIRRTRQKLQEKHPNLRGQRYEERQQKLEPEVREVMRAWK
jgi:hypothetical protein